MKMNEIEKRATILGKCLHISTEKIIINQPLFFPDYETTYTITDKENNKNNEKEYLVLSKKDRIDCSAWRLWELWENFRNKNILLKKFFSVTERDYLSDKDEHVPEEYWELYHSLPSISAHPYVHIIGTHPILCRMAEIIGEMFGYAILLIYDYSEKIELTFRDFSTTRLKKYYIYQRFEWSH